MPEDQILRIIGICVINFFLAILFSKLRACKEWDEAIAKLFNQLRSRLRTLWP